MSDLVRVVRLYEANGGSFEGIYVDEYWDAYYTPLHDGGAKETFVFKKCRSETGSRLYSMYFNHYVDIDVVENPVDAEWFMRILVG